MDEKQSFGMMNTETRHTRNQQRATHQTDIEEDYNIKST